MLILHIYIKLNRLLHCFLTSASIHDYLFWFLCKMAYKHGAGILSACQWVCFQWQPMALIIVLILQGLYRECLPWRPQLICHSVNLPESWEDLFLTHLPRRYLWLIITWHNYYSSTKLWNIITAYFWGIWILHYFLQQCKTLSWKNSQIR